jgi:hypothetical protein
MRFVVGAEMEDIHRSTHAYETWLRHRLGDELVEAGLARKHEKMRKDAFSFLRATYWRWAETVLIVCPGAADAPTVLAVGDVHLENFGTWRDADGRLAWGVNDFDDAAEMPYVVDLLRLASSAILAAPDSGVAPAVICRAILRGYRNGVEAPQPLILDRDFAWLRELVAVSDKQRAKFWRKIDEAQAEPIPARYRKAIAAAMPEPRLALTTARRTAGTGSLGRPRWIGIANWRGAPVVREAKALLPSSWERSNGGPNGGKRKIRCAEIAGGRYRATDPWFRVDGGVAVRRLSPNNRKIEADDATLLSPRMLEAMGFDLASAHLGTGDHGAEIQHDLSSRRPGWLLADAKKMATAVSRDHAAWKETQT